MRRPRTIIVGDPKATAAIAAAEARIYEWQQAVAKSFEQFCDAIDIDYPPKTIAAEAEASFARATAIIKRAVTATAADMGLPEEFVARAHAWLDEHHKRRCSGIAEWLYEEQRSRLMARKLGRAMLLGHGYVTTGESNWLTHPEMRGPETLIECMDMATINY